MMKRLRSAMPRVQRAKHKPDLTEGEIDGPPEGAC